MDRRNFLTGIIAALGAVVAKKILPKALADGGIVPPTMAIPPHTCQATIQIGTGALYFRPVNDWAPPNASPPSWHKIGETYDCVITPNEGRERITSSIYPTPIPVVFTGRMRRNLHAVTYPRWYDPRTQPKPRTFKYQLGNLPWRT